MSLSGYLYYVTHYYSCMPPLSVSSIACVAGKSFVIASDLLHLFALFSLVLSVVYVHVPDFSQARLILSI